MRLPTKEMREHPLFAWLPEEGFETFEACFDMEAENLGAGERRESRGRLGYLLSGRLHAADGEAVRPGELFGLSAAGGGRCLTAQVPSTVIWMDREIMTRVCYFDCWFHGRFVTELKQALSLVSAAGGPAPRETHGRIDQQTTGGVFHELCDFRGF